MASIIVCGCKDIKKSDVADMIIVPVTTKSLGGDGLAEMTIEIGEFGVDEAQWNAEPQDEDKECPRKWFSDLRGHLVFA